MNNVRSQEEIVRRIESAKVRDSFAFEYGEYISSLNFENAKQYLNDDVTEEQWNQILKELDIDKHAKEYMDFWLSKIEGERGISVSRATMHYTAWKWLLGHPDADTFPGSVNGGDGGWYQRDAYNYIKNQIDSGEWDRMTESAMKAVGESA